MKSFIESFGFDKDKIYMNGSSIAKVDYTPYRIKGFNVAEHRRIALVLAKLERKWGIERPMGFGRLNFRNHPKK